MLQFTVLIKTSLKKGSGECITNMFVFKNCFTHNIEDSLTQSILISNIIKCWSLGSSLIFFKQTVCIHFISDLNHHWAVPIQTRTTVMKMQRKCRKCCGKGHVYRYPIEWLTCQFHILV